MRWTNSDVIHAREARFQGGPNDQLTIPVAYRGGQYRHPDVTEMSGYVFDAEAWEFRWTEVEGPREGAWNVPGMTGEAGDGSV